MKATEEIEAIDPSKATEAMKAVLATATDVHTVEFDGVHRHERRSAVRVPHVLNPT